MLPKTGEHTQAKLSRSELITLGLLLALKGTSQRAFYRWLKQNRIVLFPALPERTRIFRRLKTHRKLTEKFLAEPTFFGVIDHNAGRSSPRTGLDWFNFFWESYSRSSKEKLIEFMEHAPDIERLKAMAQEDLATEYCTRMANSIMRREAADVDAVASAKPAVPSDCERLAS